MTDTEMLLGVKRTDVEREFHRQGNLAYLASRGIPDTESQQILDRAITDGRDTPALETGIVMLEAERFLRDRGNSHATPLSDAQEAVYEAIRDNGPIQGKDICKLAGVEYPNLRNHLLPALRKVYDIHNKRGAGYYLPDKHPM